jgi:hypothetical protein
MSKRTYQFNITASSQNIRQILLKGWFVDVMLYVGTAIKVVSKRNLVRKGSL